MIEPSTAQRQNLFKDDPSRPIFHFLPAANWMNDPNGVIQWKGQYHLFYQYNPDGAYHENMHWGHAVSDDLIHWQDLPIALSPSHPYDEGGIFSGCAIDNNGIPTIFYTGVNHNNTVQTQCTTTSHDDLITWQKHPNNPLIPNLPSEANQTTDFRDPFVWQDGDLWYMAVGSTIADKGGAIFLYQSEDLVNWQYLNPLYQSEDDNLGKVWECPNFFKIGEKWVLIISCNSHDITGDVIYFVGTYDNHRFTPEHQGVLDHAYLYAPLTLEDDKGRRLLWGWVREGRTAKAHTAAGWAGAQSIPRILSLDQHNHLLSEPAPELESIRGNCYQYGDTALNGAIQIDTTGLALDIVAKVELSLDSRISLALACSLDLQTRTLISYDAASQQLTLNRENSSLDGANERHTHSVPHTLYEGETLDLRILLDGSIIEVIANKRTSITSRIYPTNFENQHIKLTGNNAHVKQLDIYEMPSIWS